MKTINQVLSNYENKLENETTNKEIKYLEFSSSIGDLDGIKLLIENGLDIHLDDDLALRISSANGQLNLVKFLVEEKNANIESNKSESLKIAKKLNFLEIEDFLSMHLCQKKLNTELKEPKNNKKIKI